ncbi:MAG TPA: M50 family metallopeptidase [Actinomycetes bacterium]|nr:M50 family metallopeptidase [Actinomycetes bacterium]
MSGAGLLGILVFFLGVMASIALHEVGHLVPAKRFGVRVTQYMVGFGPTIWSKTKGETEYGAKAIPLGGYIRMVGMFPPRRNRDGELVVSATSTGPFQSMIEDARRTSADEISAGEEHRAFYQLTVPKKLVIMLGGPTMNLVLAILLFTIALALVGNVEPTPKVFKVAACVPSAAGEKCEAGDPSSPAADAGLQKGDVIVAINGQTGDSWNDFLAQVRDSAGEQVTLTVERDGETVTLTPTIATTKVENVDHPGEFYTAGFLGVSPTIAQVRQPISAVPGRMWQFVSLSAQSVAAIPSKMVGIWNAAFSNQERDVNSPVSLVGVGRISAEVAEGPVPISWKLSSWLLILASLNMALFLFNLIPLLPLDGGHVAGALYEGGRRQIARVRHRPDPGPVDVARMLPVAYTVAIVLIAMSSLLIYADVVNPIRVGG